MKNYDNIDLDDMFFGNPPKIKDFQMTLKKILDNIEDISGIQIKKNNLYE